MKSEYEAPFFKTIPNDKTSNQSAEEIKAGNIKNLKESIRLSRESRDIGEKTTYEIYKQDLNLEESKKDLRRMNKPLKKADESLTNMADGCGGSCTIF